MKEVGLAEAKATLSALLDRVERGETIVITRHHEPVAEIRPLKTQARGLRPWGLAKGEFVVPDDFNDPLPDDLLDLFEGKGDKDLLS
ncbi:MAG: prevent-host-death protein [Acidobacteria bacterium RIFCSPLOWO2_12_FULL_67_14b]|nr:MAG: prevent-host-death protein [Acidobacteria bacterium RIFCSPLOWO2_12_FULL_67_14b]